MAGKRHHWAHGIRRIDEDVVQVYTSAPETDERRIVAIDAAELAGWLAETDGGRHILGLFAAEASKLLIQVEP